MKSSQVDPVTRPLSLTPNFILPEYKRPQLAQVSPLSSIPVIDLNDHGDNDGQGLSAPVQKISLACEEFGFFQVINHGIPEELCDNVMTAVTEFFELPPEEKAEFFTEDLSKRVKLFNYFLKVEGQEKVRMWSESFFHPWHPEEDFTHFLPKTPPKYRGAFAEYAKEIGALMNRLLSLISQALGLEKDGLQRRLGNTPTRNAQANSYPPCPDPELTLGLAAHTDLGVLTVLRQAGVTGLQVIKDGKWVAVDPVPNAFVINLGDQIQVLSNGRFKSVHHRAVTHKTQPRLSLALFCAPAMEAVIGPIEDLIGEEDPPIYRNYRYAEFLEEFRRQEGTRRMVKEFFQLSK